LDFPSDLTNTERKYIHQLASQIGLVSKSVGKGDQRRITVSKRNEHHIKKPSGEEEVLPVLKIGKGGIDSLSKHIQNFPPSHTEEMESKETGASLIEAMQKQRQQNSTTNTDDNDDDDNGMDVVLTAALEELNKGGPRVARAVEIRSKSVDMARRIEQHTHYQQLKRSNHEYHRIIQNRAKLPAYTRQEEIVQTITTNPITIIQGGTCHTTFLFGLDERQQNLILSLSLTLTYPYLFLKMYKKLDAERVRNVLNSS
jgi:hypothetical protein